MKKSDVTKFFKGIQRGVGKHSPEILTGIGIAGMLTTTVLAVQATPKALKLIETEEYERKEYLTVPEKVKIAWKPYIPAAITGVASTVCLIGSCKVSTRRVAALTTAYKISETALSEYKEKVIETIGDKKEKVVREKIAKDKIEKNPISKTEVIMTGNGEVQFYEPLSGRYFKSDINRVDKAINELNYQMHSCMYVSLNDLFSAFGLPGTSLGSKLGWAIDKGLIEVDKHAQVAEDGTPCLCLDYLIPPQYDFDKFA